MENGEEQGAAPGENSEGETHSEPESSGESEKQSEGTDGSKSEPGKEEVKNANGSDKAEHGSSSAGTEKNTSSPGQGAAAESGRRGDNRGEGSVSQPTRLKVGDEGDDKQADGAGDQPKEAGESGTDKAESKRTFWGYKSGFRRGRNREA